jgi:hypothetical protein
VSARRGERQRQRQLHGESPPFRAEPNHLFREGDTSYLYLTRANGTGQQARVRPQFLLQFRLSKRKFMFSGLTHKMATQASN